MTIWDALQQVGGLLLAIGTFGFLLTLYRAFFEKDHNWTIRL